MHFNAVFPGGVVYGVTRYRFNDDQANSRGELFFAGDIQCQRELLDGRKCLGNAIFRQ